MSNIGIYVLKFLVSKRVSDVFILYYTNNFTAFLYDNYCSSTKFNATYNSNVAMFDTVFEMITVSCKFTSTDTCLSFSC